MSAFAWLRRRGRPSSPPETSSSAGRHSASRRPAPSSGSSSPASAQRVLAACASGAARRLRHGLRPVLASALFALALLAGLPTGAQAQVACSTANADGSYNVPLGWALKPSGLAAGTKFRLLFVTSTTRNATATDIATYNTFVQTRAKAGHSAISDSCGNLFKAVGSTSAIDARVNTDTESTDTAALIYWLTGAKVADTYTDFYDGSWDNYTSKTETGANNSTSAVIFTGSNNDGTKHASEPLGASSTVRTGRLNVNSPFSQDSSHHNISRAFYALSPIFTVGTKPAVTISASHATVTEGATVTFTLTSSPAPTANLPVNVFVAQGDGDNVLASGEAGFKTFTIQANQATATFTVGTDDDSTAEESGEVGATVLDGTGYIVHSTSSAASFTVADNDTPTVGLSVSDSGAATEGGSALTITATRSETNTSGSAIMIPIQVRAIGTTAQAADYMLASSISIPNNAASGTTTFTVVDDSQGETDETVVVELGTIPSGTVADVDNSDITITIVDNDTLYDTLTLLPLGGPRIHLDIGTSPELTGSGRDWTLEEGALIALRFSNLTRTLHSQDLTVNYAVAGAKHHVPDGHRGTRTVTIPANTRSVTVTLPTEATTADETDAKLSVMLLAAPPPMGETNTLGTYTTNFRPLNFTVTDGSDGFPANTPITPVATVETWYANPSNDPDEPDAADPRIEGDDLQFDVRSHPAAQVPFTVWLKVEETVGTGYGDCIAAGQERVHTVRFTPGASRRSLRVPTVDDDVDEHDCEVTVSLASDAAGTVPVDTAIVQTGGRGGYRITKDPGAGPTVRGKFVATRLVRDNEAGPKGSGSPGGIGPVTPGAGPAVTISADATEVDEGGDVTFTVTADPAPARDLEVTVSADEEMGSGDDRTGGGHFGTVTVRAGQTTATWTLTTISDQVALADGTVTGRIEAGDGYTVGTPFEVTVALLDDDGVTTQSVPDSVVGDPVTPGVNAALVAEVTAKADGHSNPDAAARLRRIVKGMTGEDGGYTAQECRDIATRHGVLSTWKPWCDEIARREAQAPPVPEQQQVVTLPAVSVSAGADVTEGGDAVFTVTASPAPASPLSVSVTVAVDGDYGVTAGTRTVPIPTTGSATLTLATVNDDADEPDGSVSVTVAAGDGYTVGSPASGSVSIADDDLPLPAIAVSAGAGVTEGGDAVFTVTASPAPASPLAVTVTVATAGEFGVTAGSRTVPIPTTGSATLTLATSDDDADEPDGSVSVTVAAGNGYTVGDPASGSVSIADDDLPPPVVSITAKSASVTEGGAAAFTLTADRAPDADLTVTLSVAETGDGDHVAAADEGPATAVIAKGATEAVFSVATVDDDANEPDGSVTVTLKDGGGYTVSPSPGNEAAVTVSDNDAAALPSLSVADVTIKEGAWMEFTVRLSAPSAGGVSVKVSTRDSTPVSATTRDYWPLSGRTVSFRAGETERSVGVIVFDDSHDEDAETFEVVLSDARGAAIADGVAVGTIVNDDPMPAAWLTRFGRTVAEQALDGIAGRMSADRTPGMQGAIAGQALSFDPAASDNPGSRGAGPGHAPDGAAVPSHAASGSPADGTGALALADVAQAFGGQSGPVGFGHDAAGFANETQSRTMTARDALLGSSFSLTGAADGSGGSMAFWGRAAQGSFDGREGTFSLDGTVTTGMLGADYARGKWLVGMALAQSEGEGDYRDTDVSPRPDGQSCPDDAEDGHPCNGAVRAGDGSVEASLTAAIPYAALQASERLKLWGAAGYGTGEVTLKTALGGSYKSDTSWSMAAAGLRGDLLAPPAEGSGPALAVTSNALWTRSSSEKTRDLAASDSDATRLRLGLEGSYRMALEGGGHLTPKLEVGARHDGGDAETGFGVEIGGGIAWVDPGLGLSLDVSGRTLIAHGNDDLKDRGYAASLAFDPDPATQRGPSLSLRQEFGGQAQGGLDALFQPATLEDRTGSEATSRWSMEAAYGFPAFGGRWTGSPHAGLGFATGARDYSVGWRLTPAANANAPDVSFGLKATRRESDSAAPEHAIGFEITVRW